MREVVNISLPAKMARDIKKEVKKGGFASTSEFMRMLIRFWADQKILDDVNKSVAEFTQGKGKRLRAVNDLDK